MNLKMFLSKNSAPIMLFTGIIGFVVTNVLTAKATEKYLKEKEKQPENTTWQQDLTVAAKCYAPAVVSGVASAGLIFGGNRQYAKVQAGLVSAYTLLNTRYSKERDAVLKNIGLEELTKIKEEINKPVIEEMKKKPVSQGSIVVNIPSFDPNIFLETTMEELENAVFHLEERLAKDSFVNLSYFVEQLAYPPNLSSETIGWNADYLYGMTESVWIDIEYELVLEDDGGQYYIVKFPVGPVPGYDEF